WASRVARSSASAKVSRRPPHTSASWSGTVSATRSQRSARLNSMLSAPRGGAASRRALRRGKLDGERGETRCDACGGGLGEHGECRLCAGCERGVGGFPQLLLDRGKHCAHVVE